jgi:hypothetical protein
MPDCPAFGESNRYQNENKIRCRNKSGTEIRGTAPDAEVPIPAASDLMPITSFDNRRELAISKSFL